MTEDEVLRKEAETRKEVDLRAEFLRTQDIYGFGTGFQTFGLRGEEKDRLEKEIASKVGSHIGYSDDEIKEVTVSAEERIKSEWRRRKEDYLEDGNENRLMIGECSPNFSEKEERLSGQILTIKQYDNLANKKTLAKEIFASKDEQTEFPVMAGKKETYGFNKEKMFEIMLENCKLSKSDQKSVSDLPKPALKKLSFAEKIKKRFTGKSKTDDENKKIMQQYDAFVKSVDKLLENYNPAHIDSVFELRSLNDLAKFERYEEMRNREIVNYNEMLNDYSKSKIGIDCYNVGARRFNENNKENVSQVIAERQQKLEQQKVEGAQQKVGEISNPQFRDTEVRKTDDEKNKEAQDRYWARKILKDRGLLKVASAPSKAGGATQAKVNVAAVAAAKQATH